MAYNIIDDNSASTLTASERASEAARILARIGDTRPAAWTQQAREFVACKQAELAMWQRVDVSVRQLFWLRDLLAQVD